MITNKEKLLIVSNLYPLPWEPNRATFNKQQFDQLKHDFEIKIIVPVSWLEYFKHRKLISTPGDVLYVPYFYIPKILRRLNGNFMYLSIKALAGKWIKSFNPDKLLGSWIFPDGFAVKKLSKDLNIPYFIKVHGSDVNAHINTPSRRKRIIDVANNSSGILSVSSALRTRLVDAGVRNELIRVIYNGVNKDLFKPCPSIDKKNNDNILFIGNIKRGKGVVELLKAFSNISIQYPELRLNYVGNGGITALLKEQTNKLGLSNRVSFLGSVPHTDLPLLINQARILALPSYAEGVPNVILEAMSCGTPVVATEVGGIPEIIKSGVNGFTAKSKDVNSLTHILIDALEHNWEHSNIALTAKPYDWDANRLSVSTMILAS